MNYLFKDKQALENIKNDVFYAEFIEDVKKLYETRAMSNIEVLPYSILKIYSETGSRKEYEDLYYRRRAILCSSFILYLLYEKEEDLKKLEDIIWVICDEYTWALPAHFDLHSPLEEQKSASIYMSQKPVKL